jgi:hypothetical protein
MPTSLLDFRHTVYSQFGEDGIIEELLKTLSFSDTENISKKNIAVDIGAYDGIKHSNIMNLVKNKQWGGIFLEARKDPFNQLLDNVRNFGIEDRVHCYNKEIDIAANSVDNILKESGVSPEDKVVLNIDIDGNDYYIWESVKEFSPVIVLIEVNSGIPRNLEYVQKFSNDAGNHNTSGCSTLAAAKLGERKGYTLVCYNEVNLIFLRSDLVPALLKLHPDLSLKYEDIVGDVDSPYKRPYSQRDAAIYTIWLGNEKPYFSHPGS